MGYIRTVVRRQAAVYIGATVQNRRGEVELEGEDSFADGRENPEESIMRDQQAALLKEMLEGISDRDREILTRFYLDEEPAAQICVSMGLSNTQFRLLKSRAKARFSAVTRRKFSEKGFYKKR
jgi:RNA polymerase sigma factor (sigma-70 family)